MVERALAHDDLGVVYGLQVDGGQDSGWLAYGQQAPLGQQGQLASVASGVVEVVQADDYGEATMGQIAY